jgi:general secretion pathway protein B
VSFILDALKKSEQERRQGEVPDLQTHQEPVARRKAVLPWAYLLVVALLVNGLIAVWALWPRSLEPVGEKPAVAGPTPTTAPVPPPAERSVSAFRPAPLQPEAAPGPAEVPEPPAPVATKVRPAPAGESPPLADNRPVPLLSELPAGDRARLPDLNLQLHFFTVHAERRMIRLNGLNLREGDHGSEGLTVVEITPEGVVLEFGGIRFLYRTDQR